MRLSDWSSDVCSSDLFEQVFQVKLSARDVFTCPTLGSLAELAASRCTAPESKKKSDDLVAAAAVGEPGPLPTAPRESMRSEERGVGKEGVGTGRTRWSAYYSQKK